MCQVDVDIVYCYEIPYRFQCVELYDMHNELQSRSWIIINFQLDNTKYDIW